MQTIDELYALVKPFLSLFYFSQIKAFQFYNTLPPEFLVNATIRTRASAIHDLSVGYTAREVESMEDIRITEHDGLFLFTIKEKISIRFKKLGDDFKSSNIETQQVFDFHHQYELPGVPPTVHLDCGYRLNRLQTEIEGIYLVWPDGNRIRKVWKLHANQDNIAAFVHIAEQPTFALYEEELPKRKKKEE